jgi:hypothetical protein
MMIGKRIGISLVALTLVGAWALPASAADEPAATAPAAEESVSPPPKAAKTEAPTAKVAKTAVVKKVRRHRPVRLVAAEWSGRAVYRSSAHFLVLGVAY